MIAIVGLVAGYADIAAEDCGIGCGVTGAAAGRVATINGYAAAQQQEGAVPVGAGRRAIRTPGDMDIVLNRKAGRIGGIQRFGQCLVGGRPGGAGAAGSYAAVYIKIGLCTGTEPAEQQAKEQNVFHRKWGGGVEK